MSSEEPEAPIPRAARKRVLIAVLLSLLLHAGAAGSATVVYLLAKNSIGPQTTRLSLSLSETGQATLNAPQTQDLPSQQPNSLIQMPESVPAPSQIASASREQNLTTPSTLSTPSAPSTPSSAIRSGPDSQPVQEPSRQRRTVSKPGESRQNSHPLSQTAVSSTAMSTPEPVPPDEQLESNTVRVASIFEHLLIQNMIATSSQKNSAIRVTETTSSSPPAAEDSVPIRSLATAMQLPHQTIRLETEIDGKQVYSLATIKEKAFSAYAHFIDRWDNDVYLSKDQVLGDFHVNSRIKLASSFNEQPRIHGRLTIGVNQFLTPEFQNQKAFLQGVESGVGLIPMDRDPLLSLMADIHQNETSIHYFQSDITLQFQHDGSVNWQSVDDDTVAGQITASDIPQVLINEGRHRFELSGEINGHFLVYSPHQILITGSLNYVNSDSGELTNSSSLLGLVSRRSVEIASRFTTGSGDLRIDAAIYAARRFSVRRFDDDHQGMLHIYGSLTAGSISATEPRFATRIEKDPRLDNIRPPGFPLTGQTVLAEWDGIWQEQPTR